MQDSLPPPHAARPEGEAPVSPCVNVCRLDERQICVGCGRHIVEITAAGVEAERRRALKLQES